MADKPIIFSGPMVQALLAGRKTQTRRALKPQPDSDFLGATIAADSLTFRPAALFGTDTHKTLRRIPRPRDRLWVRETWSKAPLSDHGDCAAYRADGNYQCGDAIREGDPIQWRSSMFMPRKYSRLTLIVTGVRVQRLQDISTSDCFAEGVQRPACLTDPGVPMLGSDKTLHDNTVRDYRTLWNSLNANRGYPWESNPWCVALTFDAIKSNIDALPTSAAGM